MKKVLLILTTIMLSFMLLIGNVLANTLEENVGNKTQTGTPCTPNTCKSGYYTSDVQGIRITIVDANGIRIPGTVSVDYLTNNKNGAYVLKNAERIITKTTYYNVNRGNRKETANASINNIFTAIPKGGAALANIEVLPNLKDYISISQKEQENLSDRYFEVFFKTMDKNQFKYYVLEKTGYMDKVQEDRDVCANYPDTYFIIEPMNRITIKDAKGNEYTYYGTGTELINVIHYYNNQGLDGYARNKMAYANFMYKDMAGYSGVKYLPYMPYDELLNKNKGYAVGSFKIGDIIEAIECNGTCYKETKYCSDTVCENTGKINERECYSLIEEVNSGNASDCQEDVKATGKKTYTLIDGVCSLYCTEVSTASYPGNVGTNVTLGTNLAWPTANGTGMYPLKTKSTLTCTIEMENGEKAVSQACKNQVQKFNYVNGANSSKLVYHDTKDDKQIQLQQTCTVTSNNFNWNTNKVTIENSCSYSLPKGQNVAVNKDTLEAVNKEVEKLQSLNNFVIITQHDGVLPIGEVSFTSADIKDLMSKKYDLKIENLPLGYSGQFTELLNQKEYVCNYKVTKNISSCYCPPGTKYSGQSLIGTMKKHNITCAEAKEKYCDKPGEKDPDPDVCPPGTTKEGDDVTVCVQDEMLKGLTKEQALTKCCNNKSSGMIIYRTISLENPFPSKNGDKGKSQSGLTVGMFNDTIKGRYPGSNWNSVKLVYNKILNNRGYNGSEIYQKAKPLYTINLDATAIKQIREYNKKQNSKDEGYADFELSCTDGAYCISRFLHNGQFKTANGKSILDASNSTCANAKDKDSFINCYVVASKG